MNVDSFAERLKGFQSRLAEMYTSQSLPPESAFKELGVASEELQIAAEEIFEQTENLAATQAKVEAERQHYQELFEFLPNAYLVTDGQGKVLEANRAAATLLNLPQRFLVGKPLDIFIASQQRRMFPSKLNQLHQHDYVREWVFSLQPRNSKAFDAALTVVPVRDLEGKATTLRWVVRELSQQKRTFEELKSSDGDLSQNRFKHIYTKGENIPLDPQTIWLACRGLVKLSTMNEKGEEVLLGLAGPSMPFGSSMTSLDTYQATVLSEEVELVSISLTEMAASPHLCQVLVPQINQRLQQTESFLTNNGKRNVKNRLYDFLLWLKREMGQPVEQGTRLGVRLTHQDIADACCTTRVTVTRELGRLQQQGEITFDSKHHIIFRDESC
ncbi:MAG: transcriptional regulator [Cyanobacteria bacterium QH_3_48_40]|nr:MAG: transcriptional regulator [Cyanobacteria bacterium QH_3_48_40]